jgi:quercetin dioxygenase-like cupin family protein
LRSKRIGVLAGSALTSLVVLLVMAVEVASQSPAGPPVPGAVRECATTDRREVLRQEQEAILRRLGRLTVLRNQADLAALGRPPLNYVFLAHQFTSFRGIGLTIINTVDTPRPGLPNLIFYAPSENAEDTTDPRGPDFPYTFVGWAYGVPYEPGRIPALIPCMGIKDWHIHERGVHPIDSGGMVVMPPTETIYGESPGTFVDSPSMEPVVGFPHPRSWTVHFWRQDNGLPSSAILDPQDPPSGINPGVGSSFYFPEQSSAGVKAAAQASRARPFIVKSGKGERVKLRESEFTFTATGDQTFGAFTVIDLDLRRGSEPPAHIHHRQAEAFYLLDGEMTFVVAGQTLTGQTGDFVFLPRGIAHVYRVDGDGSARVLLFSAPPGLENFFRAASPDPTDLQVSEAYGIEPVGPPLRSP